MLTEDLYSQRSSLLVMLKRGWWWVGGFLLITLLFVQQVRAQVVITEVMYDPPQRGDAGYEWLEIQNISEATLLIADITFIEGGVRHRVEGEEGATLSPGEVAVIVQNPDLFLESYPEYTDTVLRSSFSLRQKDWIGEALELQFGEDDTNRFWFMYVPDARANGTGATVHVSEGAQLIAPATPGEVAINPITIEEEVAEEEVQEEVVLETMVKEALEKPLPPPIVVAPPPVTFPRPLLEQTPPPTPLIVDLPDYRPLLSLVIGVLLILAFEGFVLLVLLSLLLQRLPYMKRRGYR